MLSPPSTRRMFPVIQYVAGWLSATMQRATSSGFVSRRFGFRFLAIIGRCREFDFSIDQVRVLVAVVQDPKSSSMDERDMAAEHLTGSSEDG
jgi:hypothetical protein